MAVDSAIYSLLVAGIVTTSCVLIKIFFRNGKDFIVKTNINKSNTQNKENIVKNTEKKNVINQEIKNEIDEDELRAEYRNSLVFPILFSLLSFIGYIYFQYWTITNKETNEFKPIFIIIGLIFFFQLFCSIFARKKTLEDNESVDNYIPIIIIPVYNEDVNSLKQTLNSLLNQSRLPNEIHIVDDGSKENYETVKKWFRDKANDLGIVISWTRHSNNKGKRAAQMTAFKNIKEQLVDDIIIITIDSDGVVDRNAIQEGLIPFKDDNVYSVAGVIVSRFANKNLLSRIADWTFVTQELVDRATMSLFGNVLVNSGAIAFYRYEVLKIAEDSGYTEEYFFNAKIEFSDDSYLTLIALQLGKTVHQPSAIAFADMPVKVNHHLRQQLRWSRGSFIRSWWRLRYLNPLSFGWIRQLIGHVTFFTVITIYLQLLILKPIFTGIWWTLDIYALGLLLSYVVGIKYLAIKRNDSTIYNQLLTFILSPLAILWLMVILRPLKLYSYITCAKSGWGTRKKVEIIHKN